jgi:hypothetical protein
MDKKWFPGHGNHLHVCEQHEAQDLFYNWEKQPRKEFCDVVIAGFFDLVTSKDLKIAKSAIRI